MIAIGPFQATVADLDGDLNPIATKVLVIGYASDTDKVMTVYPDGRMVMVERFTTTVDWRYNPDLNTWEDATPSSPLEEVLARAKRGLYAIAAYDHTDLCPNREDFSVWDCNCNTLKPDVMARMTLEHLEEMEDADAPELVGSGAAGEAASGSLQSSDDNVDR